MLLEIVNIFEKFDFSFFLGWSYSDDNATMGRGVGVDVVLFYSWSVLMPPDGTNRSQSYSTAASKTGWDEFALIFQFVNVDFLRQLKHWSGSSVACSHQMSNAHSSAKDGSHASTLSWQLIASIDEWNKGTDDQKYKSDFVQLHFFV